MSCCREMSSAPSKTNMAAGLCAVAAGKVALSQKWPFGACCGLWPVIRTGLGQKKGVGFFGVVPTSQNCFWGENKKGKGKMRISHLVERFRATYKTNKVF